MFFLSPPNIILLFLPPIFKCSIALLHMQMNRDSKGLTCMQSHRQSGVLINAHTDRDRCICIKLEKQTRTREKQRRRECEMMRSQAGPVFSPQRTPPTSPKVQSSSLIQWEKPVGGTCCCDWCRVLESPPFLRSWREFPVSFLSATLTELQNRGSRGLAVCGRSTPHCGERVSQCCRPVSEGKQRIDHQPTCGLHVHR